MGFFSRRNVFRFIISLLIIVQVILQYERIWSLAGWPYRGKTLRIKVSRRNNTLLSPNQLMIMSDPDLPLWMKEYLSWHVEMRERFPGDELYHHPDAPNLIVRICFKFCGGLNDRLGQLPWDVYLAARTKRVLLIHWARPTPLENYLQPNVINFTFPDIRWFPTNGTIRVPDHYYHYFCQKAHNIFHGFKPDRPNEQFFTTHFDQAVNNSIVEDVDRKVLRFELVGHIGEHFLKSHVQKTFQSNIDVTEAPVFGKLFHLFFKPSPQVQLALQQQQKTLVPGQYSAAHCRVRHPFSGKDGTRVKSKNSNYTADHIGLAWHDNDEGRHHALTDAVRALSCLTQHKVEPVYFFSDSFDLVQFLSQTTNYTTTTTTRNNNNNNNNTETYQPRNEEERQMKRQFDQFTIVTRSTTEDGQNNNVHIDKQIDLNVSAYYGTFIDLFIAIQARCIVYGIGKFAYFASKISGTPCHYVYRQEEWGRGGKRDEPISKECLSNLTILTFNNTP